MTQAIQLNILLTRGETAEIYAVDSQQILKLFNEGFPIEYVEHEAVVTHAIYEAGLPVPQVGEVVEIDGRFGFLQQKITGPSLLEVWLQNRTETDFVAQTLAELHSQIHATLAPQLENLPRQREWVGNLIQESEELSAEVKTKSAKQLTTLADGAMLCHGDFHPGNVLFTEAGKCVIIDWFTAVSGHPLGDIAQTSLLLTAAPLPPPLNEILTTENRHAVSEAYIRKMLAGQPAAIQTQLETWQAVAQTAAHALFTGE